MRVAEEAEKEAEIEPLVEADQIKLLYSKGLAPFLASIVNATLYGSLVWHDVPRASLTAWWLAIVAMSVFRVVQWRLYARRPRGLAETRFWAHAATIGALLHGSLWGSAALFVYPRDSLTGQIMLAFVSGGMAAGASTLSASHLPTYFAYAIPTVTPVCIRLFATPDHAHRVMGIQLTLFVVAIGAMARASGRFSREASQLRFRLMLAGQHLTELNETLESRVVERTAALQSALAARDEFILVASHELRTPLTTLKTQLQLIDRDLRKTGMRVRVRLSPRFAMLARQSTRLSLLVSTLLDVSSLADAKLKLEPRQVDQARVIRRVGAEMEDDLRGRGSALLLQLEEPLVGYWDPVRVEQVVMNLLSNASKYGAGKPVCVALERDGAGARVTVIDRGIGILPEDLSRIFGKYERASPARGYGGLGLGLFVVQQLVMAMDGTIEVQSPPGEGARFTVWLPSLVHLREGVAQSQPAATP